MSIASPFRLVSKTTLENIHMPLPWTFFPKQGSYFNPLNVLKFLRPMVPGYRARLCFLPRTWLKKPLHRPRQALSGQDATQSTISWWVRVKEASMSASTTGCPIYIQDQDHGRRLGTRADLVNLYKLAQHSKVCNINGQIPVEPSDITHPKRYLDIFHELLTPHGQTTLRICGYPERKWGRCLT